MLHYDMLRYVMLHYDMLRYVMLRYDMLRYVTLCYVTICYVTICYVTICCVTLFYVTCAVVCVVCDVTNLAFHGMVVGTEGVPAGVTRHATTVAAADFTSIRCI